MINGKKATLGKDRYKRYSIMVSFRDGMAQRFYPEVYHQSFSDWMLARMSYLTFDLLGIVSLLVVFPSFVLNN